MATGPRISSIGLALAGKSASVDIPKPRDSDFAGRDNLAVVATKQTTTAHHGLLPTPPNSISPLLVPQNFNKPPIAPHSPPASSPQFESDIDLQEAADSRINKTHGLNSEALDRLGDLDSAGAITPSLLAKHHLPDILLSHGPLAIRHIMGYLTTTVPGFSRIPPAKARRLVVGALEGRGSGGEGGGVDGSVVFEKVGWGRWDGRLRGQPSRDHLATLHSPPPSLPSSYSTTGLQNLGNHRGGRLGSGDSGTAHSAVYSYSATDYGDQDVDMVEPEADNMSLDERGENGYCSSSEAADDLYLDGDLGEGDVTDEEDWAAIGAAALRAKSFPIASGGSRLYQPIAYHTPTYTGSGRSLSKLVPAATAKAVPQSTAGSVQVNGFSFLDGVTGNTQERDAVEALLRLGSM